jgi:hypothetical protein
VRIKAERIQQLGYRLVVRTARHTPLLKIASPFNALLASALGVRVVPAERLGRNWFDRILYFQRLFDLLADVKGDVVECGVASGYTLAMLASLARSSGTDRHIWGFDCWEGLPEPSGEDLVSGTSSDKKGMFGDSSMEFVLQNLRWCGFSDSETKKRVTLVKGYFSNTLPGYKGDNVALLHIDADLYESYMDVLRNLWPKVAAGGIIALDEYQALGWPGAKRAVDEFLSQLPPGSVRLHQDSLYDRYYIIKTP